MKIVRTATKSDEHHATAKECLQGVLEKIEAMGTSIADNNDEANTPNVNELEHDFSNGNNGRTQNEGQPAGKEILPPPISKTNGSRSKKTTQSKTTAAPNKKVEEPELDDEGKHVIGRRRCSYCGKKNKHNSHSCPDDPSVAAKKRLGKKVKVYVKGATRLLQVTT
jgi:hypothetical protein